VAVRPKEGELAPLATGQTHHSQHQTDRRDCLPDPEEEHPLDDPGLERGHAGVETTLEHPERPFDFRDPLVELRVELRRTLLELGIESPEVQLVELSQLGSVRGVHLVER